LNAIERLGRKRRDRRTQTQPEPPFAVESCECLTDGPFALLRVSGTGVSAPTMLVGEGDSPESFEPLPQPGAPSADGAWRMAFALPAELGISGTRLWLHDGGVYLVELVVPAAAELPAVASAPALASAPAVAPAPAVASASAVEPPLVPEAEAADDAEDAPAGKLVEAWAEAATLREKLSDREEELAQALQELLDARHNLQPLRERAEELTIELAAARAQPAQQGQPDPVEGVAQAQEPPEGTARRRGLGRRNDDRQLRKLRDELEAQITEREKRIEELEHEAESFAKRRDDAVAQSLRARVGELEDEVRQHTGCNEDLRSLLESERELMGAARREVQDLKRQLASAKANRVADAAVQNGDDPASAGKPAVKPQTEQMPWSALDDELLARIEKAKALTS
jgi:phage shock protein A